MTVMSKHTAFMIFILLGLVPCSARSASAEYWPPPKLHQLANASIIVQGHYELANGQPKFVLERFIAPENARWTSSPGSDLQVEEGGTKITSEIVRNTLGRFYLSRIDATQSRLWLVGIENVPRVLFSRDLASIPMVEPVELADGYLALRKGKQPPLLFSLLQRWDALLQRDAMETIVAGKDPQTLKRLQAIADDPDSEASGTAIHVLRQMNLLDINRYWETWTKHRSAYSLSEDLLRIDKARATRQILKGLKQPSDERELRNCIQFKHLLPEEQLLSVLSPYLTHASAVIRSDVANFLGGRLMMFYRQQEESPAAQKFFDEFREALVPLLKKGAAEDPDEDVRKTFQRGLDAFQNRGLNPSTPEPPLTYQPSKNLKLIVGELTTCSRKDARIRRAGKELAKYEFEAGFAEMQRRLAGNSNVNMVMFGFGFIDDPRTFDFVVDHLSKIGLGHSTYPEAVQAIALLNQPKSLEVLLNTIEQKERLDHMTAEYYFDALAEIKDKQAVAEIRKLEPYAEYRASLKYIRALVKHGDPWAINQLLSAAKGNADETVLKDERWHSSNDYIDTLLLVDDPQATALLKNWVNSAWYTREKYRVGFGGPEYLNPQIFRRDLENYVGDERRSSVFAEVARRDPHWLAEQALRSMASDFFPERATGYHIFRSLTGRSMGFDPAAFHAERQPALTRLQAWWREHGDESRDQWLLSYFAEAGYPMERFDAAAVPTLVKVLEADEQTLERVGEQIHELALEQLELITDLIFDTRDLTSYRGQQYNITNVTGKLRARGWLEAD